jgi:hypothetical protein
MVLEMGTQEGIESVDSHYVRELIDGENQRLALGRGGQDFQQGMAAGRGIRSVTSGTAQLDTDYTETDRQTGGDVVDDRT